MARGSRSTDGLGSVSTLAVLAIVLQFVVASAANARSESLDRRMTPSVVHTLQGIIEHAAPPIPKASVVDSVEDQDAGRPDTTPNQPARVTRSGDWVTAVPPPSAA